MLRPMIRQAAPGLLSGLLLILAFPPFNLEFVAWFAFVPLILAVEQPSCRRPFLCAYAAGSLFWLGTICWLIHVTAAGMVVLSLYLALYFGLFGRLLAATNRQKPGAGRMFFIATLWVCLEYLRSYLFTGFPWALLGYSQYLHIPVLQIADTTGTWGVSFVIMLANAGIAAAFRRQVRAALICALVVAGVHAYGFWRMAQAPAPLRPAVSVAVVQGNIPQQMKWDAAARTFILQKYLGLSAQAAEGAPDLIAWPEAAFPFPGVELDKPQVADYLRSLLDPVGVPLLLGAVTLEGDRYYNSAVFFQPQLPAQSEAPQRASAQLPAQSEAPQPPAQTGNAPGRASAQRASAQSYHKLHLVPFGEYIPLRSLLPFLETVVPIGDVSRGSAYTVFKLVLPAGQAGFSTLICFEDVFPELSRRFVLEGAQFLVNITNDAWYEHTAASSQHLQASVLRAVENRIWVVRSANTGISGFIRPDGQIAALVQNDQGEHIFVDGVLTREVPLRSGPMTLYTRWGDLFVFLCILCVFLGLAAARMVAKKR